MHSDIQNNKVKTASECCSNQNRTLIVLLFTLILLRFFSLALYPLMDNTEARYGEIGRKMLVMGDWITPWFSQTEPFWGKPPLSFWATALSFKLFGISELTARLPHFLCGIAIGVYLYVWVKQLPFFQLVSSSNRSSIAIHSDHLPSKIALYTTVFLAASLQYFLASGTVMTDMWMLLAIVVVMVSYWNAMYYYHQQEKLVMVNPNKPILKHPLSAWLLFVGLGLGLLAKGPIAVVLCGLAILPWMLLTKNFLISFRCLPMIRGLLLTCLIAAPWYLLAELKTPGFLKYFIIGEHFERFLVSGWTGDRYGSAHVFPRGTIWLFLLVDLFPWVIILPIVTAIIFIRRYCTARPCLQDNHTAETTSHLKIYLYCWALSTPIFFTFAGNILWSYALPAMPAIAILLAQGLTKLPENWQYRSLMIGLMTSMTLLVLASGYLLLSDKSYDKSAKGVLELYYSNKAIDKQIFYLGNPPYSAVFYSQGAVQPLQSLAQINHRDSSTYVLTTKILQGWSELNSQQENGNINKINILGDTFEQGIAAKSLNLIQCKGSYCLYRF